MGIRLTVRPQFRHHWTEITVEGEYEESVANVLVSRLFAADYEIFREDEDGEFVTYKEYE